MSQPLDDLAARAGAELGRLVADAGSTGPTGSVIRRRAARRQRTVRGALALSLLVLTGTGVALTRDGGDEQSTVVANRPTGADEPFESIDPAAETTTTTTTALTTTTTAVPGAPAALPTTSTTAKPAADRNRPCAPAPTANDAPYAGPARQTVAVGADGSLWTTHREGVFTSTDGGASWTWRCFNHPALPNGQRTLPLGPFGFIAIDANHAVAFGSGKNFDAAGAFIATRDGGRTWDNGQTDDPYRKSLFDADFVTPTTGWIVGTYLGVNGHPPLQGAILRTTDGGTTWDPLPTPGRHVDDAGIIRWDVKQLNVVSFLDGTDGWVGAGSPIDPPSDQRLFSTGDGGATWTPILLPDNTGAVTDLLRLDRDHAHVLTAREVGSTRHRSIHTTADGGRTWTTTELEPQDLADPTEQIVATGAGRAVIVAGGPSQTTIIVATDDAGANWTHIATAEHPSGDVAVSGSRIWATADVPAKPCLYSSDDQGRTWNGHPLIAGAACPVP